MTIPSTRWSSEPCWPSPGSRCAAQHSSHIAACTARKSVERANADSKWQVAHHASHTRSRNAAARGSCLGSGPGLPWPCPTLHALLLSQVSAASSGEAALQRLDEAVLSSHPPDILLLDVMMPGASPSVSSLAEASFYQPCSCRPCLCVWVRDGGPAHAPHAFCPGCACGGAGWRWPRRKPVPHCH